MKKIFSFLAAFCAVVNALGQGYWVPITDGASGDFPNITAVVNALLHHNGTIYQAGSLGEVISTDYNNVYALDSIGYMLGSGTTALNEDGNIWALCADGQNNIYAAGATDFNNTPGFDVIKWNGSVWAPLGAEAPLMGNGFINTLCSDAANNIYAAGRFRNGSSAGAKYYVAHWDGSAWSELGGFNALGAGAAIQSITTDPAGNLYAAGVFTNASGNHYVAKWNGTAWSELGGANALAANDNIESIYADAVGNLYAGGRFTNAAGSHYVAKWNGSAWSELGIGANALNANGTIRGITGDAFGNIYAAGQFANSQGDFYVAKWNDTTWAELGAGAYSLNANAWILALCTDAQGRVYAAGNFSDANGIRYVARYTDNFDVTRVEVKVFNNLPPQITINGGTLQMASRVFPVMGNQNVTWSISPGSLATISATGKITALDNGEVWPKATSVENPALSDSMKVTISGQEATGIVASVKTDGLRLFPNPAGDELFIELASQYKKGVLTVYDSKGVAVLKQKSEGRTIRLNIHPLPQGVYSLQYVDATHRLNATFTKQK